MFRAPFATIGPQVKFDGRSFCPATLSRSIQQIVRFPEKSVDFQSTTKLFTETHDLFVANGFSADAASAVTHFNFAAWFADVLPAAPCLLITGPKHEANFLLDLLASSVPHPLPTSEFTARALCSLPMELRPTLLIDAGEITRASLKLLRTSNRQRAFFPLRGSLVNVYCAKALYCGKIADTYAMDDSALHIDLQAFSDRLPVLNQNYSDQIARKFQAKFLAYRCRYVLDVRDSHFDRAEFISETRILARVLGAPIINAPALQAGLSSLLEEHERKKRASQWTDLRCVVLEAVIHHAHKEPGTWVHVAEITKTATAILAGRGDATEPDPREIGPILRTFGLLAERDNGGWAILLSPARCREMHQLARQFGVLEKRKGKAPCPHCDEILSVGKSK